MPPRKTTLPAGAQPPEPSLALPADSRLLVIDDNRDNDTDQTDGERYIVPALRRGLSVLRLFSRNRRIVTLPEIVRELGVPRATAFRLAHTLEADGYLQRTPHSNAFQLGLNVLSLGFEYLGSLDLLDIARPALEALRDRLDLSVHMGVRDGTDVVYVVSLPSQHRLRSNVSVGTRSPAHANSIGRATLFDLSLDELQALYRGVEMERFSAQTPTTVEALYQQLEQERQRGYVSWRSAIIPGIATVSAPIRNREGRIAAALNISDYESLPAMEEQEGRVKDEVLHTAAAVSQNLGYRPRSDQAPRTRVPPI